MNNIDINQFKTGDVLHCRGRRLISKLIRWATKSQINHTALFIWLWDERALPRREEHPGCDNHLTDALLYSWRHCYQYLADTLAPNGMRAGNTQGEWVMLEYETELEKQLEEKHYQEQQLAMWGDN